MWTTCKAPMRTAPKSPPIPTNFKSSTIRWPYAAKLERLIAAGERPYDGKVVPTHMAEEVVARFDELEGQEVTLAGRLRAMRVHGGASFADLHDSSGRIQLFVRLDSVGQPIYDAFKELDLGDVIGVTGKVFKTRRGEVSVEVASYELLAKALRPLPEKWHGLRDIELRYRRRYLDLTVNPDSRQVFIIRSQVIASIRRALVERGYIEVETPMLHPIPGGANARPFETYHNALDMPLYMRIAPELYLKRLLVGGFDKVFEIGKNFRNEGISTRHNPEYTSLEAYQAYADYEDMMELTESLVAGAAQEVLGTTKIEYQGREIDLSPPWERLSMLEAIRRYAGIDFEAATGAKWRWPKRRASVSNRRPTPGKRSLRPLSKR